MMERLTGRNEKGDLLVNGKMVYSGEFYEVASALEEYEDLEEDGKLLKLPCKPGDTVYIINTLQSGKKIIAEMKADTFFLALCVMEKRFGKNVFLTEQEALEALEGMKE